jgi:hypothetical protein
MCVKVGAALLFAPQESAAPISPHPLPVPKRGRGQHSPQITECGIDPRSNSKNLQVGLENEEQVGSLFPLSLTNLARNGVNRCGPFVTLFKLELNRILD